MCNFFQFWLCWVSVATCGLSLTVESGAALCCSARASRGGARALGARASVVAVHGLGSHGARA